MMGKVTVKYEGALKYKKGLLKVKQTNRKKSRETKKIILNCDQYLQMIANAGQSFPK